MANAVFYIAPDDACVARVACELARAGLPKSELTVLGVDGSVHATRVLEVAAVCAALGGVLGGLLAWSLALRGATFGPSPLDVSGSSLALVIGLAVGAAAGSLTGSLIGLGLPPSRAQRLLARFGKGGVLVSVHSTASGHGLRLERILSAAGAVEVPTADDREP